MVFFLFCRFKIHKVLQRLEDQDENEQPCDIVFHIPPVQEIGLTVEDSANSDGDRQYEPLRSCASEYYMRLRSS
jgi:hypothetical protein